MDQPVQSHLRFTISIALAIFFGLFRPSEHSVTLENGPGTFVISEDDDSSVAACGIQLNATDNTSYVTLLYQIDYSVSTPDTVNKFVLTGSSDVLSCRNNPPGFDYYLTSVYFVKVLGCCSGTQGGSTTFTFSILQRPEGPYWNTSIMTTSMSEVTTVGTPVFTMSSYCYPRQNSNHSLAFAFNSTTEPYFSISSSIVYVASLYSLDYPSPLATDYYLYLVCSDTFYLSSATATLAITVLDTNTATPFFNFSSPVFTLTTMEVGDFVALTPGVDYDRSTTYNSLTYSLSTSQHGPLFRYNTPSQPLLSIGVRLNLTPNDTFLYATIYATDAGGLVGSATITIYYNFGSASTSTSTSTSTETSSSSSTTTAQTATLFAQSPTGIGVIVACSVVGAAAIGVGLFFVARQSNSGPPPGLSQIGPNRPVDRNPPWLKQGKQQPPPEVPTKPREVMTRPYYAPPQQQPPINDSQVVLM